MIEDRRRTLLSALGGSFAIPTFDGSHAVFGDEKQGYIELYSSGTLTFPKNGTVDIFVVAGGSGANPGTGSFSSPTSTATGGQGGRAGAHNTWFAQEVEPGIYSIIVGSANGASSFDGYTTSGYSGTGGAAPTVSVTDFSATKKANGNPGSAGVHPFSDINFTRVCGAGGSGGAVVTGNATASGGSASDGGGPGGAAKATGGSGTYVANAGSPGTANTGGGGGGGASIRSGNNTSINRTGSGGAGGSGIVIIRWGYDAA